VSKELAGRLAASLADTMKVVGEILKESEELSAFISRLKQDNVQLSQDNARLRRQLEDTLPGVEEEEPDVEAITEEQKAEIRRLAIGRGMNRAAGDTLLIYLFGPGVTVEALSKTDAARLIHHLQTTPVGSEARR
jgi:archaellum component FlaC